MSTERTHRTLAVNGINMHVAEQGNGPLVVLCHGWPELWYSWRHQLPALAAAGFHAVAPDMRGFGRTDAPKHTAAYSILDTVGDMVSLVTALGEREAVIVGHDWGATVAWSAALLRPEMFHAVVGMSVPFRPRPPSRPLAAFRKMGLDNFYWIYFQAEGVAEREFEKDAAATLRRLLYTGSGDFTGDSAAMLLVPPGGGFLDNTIDPAVLPAWLTDEDISAFAAEYRRTGFRPGLNWYRNIDRNWELLAAWDDVTIQVPALFIAGERDLVLAGERGVKAVEQMTQAVPRLQEKVFIPGAGHWIQQERADDVNAALIDFLTGLRNG